MRPKATTRLYLLILNINYEAKSMTDEKHKSYAEKNEERILDFVESIDEKGEKKKEQKEKASEARGDS